MEKNKQPHYEAIGRCVFLRREIDLRIKYFDDQLSLLNEIGIAPYYSDRKKPQLTIDKRKIDTFEKMVSEIQHVYDEVHKLASDYNVWAEHAGYELIDILVVPIDSLKSATIKLSDKV